ncbi:MAG: energy-coupling factor transporter ATPase [Clostridiales bacterium]|nr:energy-coupling factor transporter ATPase [Clostridiales bacterium]
MSIKIKNLTHIYNEGSPYQTNALENINVEIEMGEFIGLIGHTGSGKSTLIQHINGLLKPDSGEIIIDDINITSKDVKMAKIRKKVGLVFQYPEHQLFEETVYKDVAFGPKNLGLDNDEIDNRVKEAIELVKLPFDTLKDRSPFELSGGQQRRVAIAGVLAMRPDVLILDEPTAGLDPKGRDEIFEQVRILHKKYNNTIILVSHSMEDIAKLADRIIVVHEGKILLTGKTKEVFSQSKKLEDIGLGVPQITKLMGMLVDADIPLSKDILTVEDAKTEILRWLRSKKRCLKT